MRVRDFIAAALMGVAAATCVPAAAGPAVQTAAGGDSAGFGPPPAYALEDLDRRTQGDMPGEDMLFAFAVIADSHIRIITSDDFRYLKAVSISRQLLANFVSDINKHTPPVDFVVHLGDVTDQGTPEEFSRTAAILENLNCPIYPVVGNHDNFTSDNKQGWLDCFGLDSTHYSFDRFGVNFIVIDCTLQPYVPPYVHCHAVERAWVEHELAKDPGKPAIILSHYNMWERGWCATFDTTCHYQEYTGIDYLKEILVHAGNVVAVLNGHVHANRWGVHDGIYYIDINATLVGRPSIRYFYVYPDRIEVDYEYISNDVLFNHVQALCPFCTQCFDPDRVCDFIDGTRADKKFTIPYTRPVASVEPGAAADFEFDVYRCEDGRLKAVVKSPAAGVTDISIHDVLGRRLDRRRMYKGGESLEVDLLSEMPSISGLGGGIYFVSATLGEATRTRKLPLY
jgi:hypothetical protein